MEAKDENNLLIVNEKECQSTDLASQARELIRQGHAIYLRPYAYDFSALDGIIVSKQHSEQEHEDQLHLSFLKATISKLQDVDERVLCRVAIGAGALFGLKPCTEVRT